MVDKHLIKIYKIFWNDAPMDIYIGSTKVNLSKRIAQHRSVYKSSLAGGFTTSLLKAITKNHLNKMQYVLLESYMVFCRDEQLKYEQQWYDKIGTLNDVRCYTDKKNKVKSTYRKHKISCHCGGSLSVNGKINKNHHFRTVKHKKYIKSILEHQLKSVKKD